MARDIYWTPASDMDDFLPARYLRHLNNLKWEYLAAVKPLLFSAFLHVTFRFTVKHEISITEPSKTFYWIRKNLIGKRWNNIFMFEWLRHQIPPVPYMRC